MAIGVMVAWAGAVVTVVLVEVVSLPQLVVAQAMLEQVPVMVRV